tara:strand:+ start:597 stop:1010 length:414 start_codon:yes stop_codon:yes gene_type:complete
MKESDIAYIAGLFDGEGTVGFYRRMETKKDRGKPRKSFAYRINVEIAMTDRSVLLWLQQCTKLGTVNKKPRKGHKMQWRWRCSFRNAYVFLLLISPYSHIKTPMIRKVIDHYSQRDSIKFNDKVINFLEYKKAMSLE